MELVGYEDDEAGITRIYSCEVQTGKLSKTSASKVLTKLSKEEQIDLLEDIGKDKIAELYGGMMLLKNNIWRIFIEERKYIYNEFGSSLYI